MSKKREKKPEVAIPSDRGEANLFLQRLGDEIRRAQRLQTNLNDGVAAFEREMARQLEEPEQRIKALTRGLQLWAERNRAVLLEGTNSKTVKLAAGDLAWRMNPVSVKLTDKEAVIAALLGRGLDRFLRVKREPNKEAMLEDPSAVEDIPGIAIVKGVECFVVTPANVEPADTGRGGAR